MNRSSLIATAAVLATFAFAGNAGAATGHLCGKVSGFQVVIHRGSVSCSEAQRVARAFRALRRHSATVSGWHCRVATAGGGCVRGRAEFEYFWPVANLAQEESEELKRDRAKAATICEEEVKEGSLGEARQRSFGTEWECRNMGEPSEVEWISQERAEGA